MIQDRFIRDLLSAAKAAGISEAEVYFQQAESLHAYVDKGEIGEYAVNTSGGLSLRGLYGGKMGTAYTEALDEAAIPMLVNAVKESAALIDDEDEQFIFAGSPAYASVDCTGDLGTPEERLSFALSLDKAGRSLDPRVTDLGLFTGVDSARETVRIENTHGLSLSHTADIVVGFVEPIARQGERVTTALGFEGACSLDGLDAEKIAREGVMEAVFQLSASPCQSGEMPVIFRNTAMANLLSVFSGVFSADAAQKGLSLLKGREGDAIAAPCVTLADDPLRRGGFATRAFDAEGVATYAKNVIDGGVLTTLLHNLKTAKKAGCASTGNAARGGYAGQVTVAPSNFFLKPGEEDLEALCARMENGLVITDLEGLHAGANPVSGDFSLLSKGYLVENGRKGRPVEQVTVAGNFFSLLKDAVAVGSDLKFAMGPVGSPSVWIRKLSVAGK